jgi:NADH-quinone oxidoreductase subunit A
MQKFSIIILSSVFLQNNNIFSNIYYSYFNEHFNYLYLYFLVSSILTLILFSLAFFLSPKKTSFEKNSSYECGFEPFGNGHIIFNIQFFIVGILFMIFDLELAYIFP